MKMINACIYLIAFTSFSTLGFADNSGVTAQEQQKALNDVNSILTDARVVPSFQNGKPAGYTVEPPNQGNPYQRLGLKNGDVITNIDGQQVNDPQQAFQKLSENKEHDIEVVRDGEQDTLPQPQVVQVNNEQARIPEQDR